MLEASFLSSDKSTSQRRRLGQEGGGRKQSSSPLPKHKPLVASMLSEGGTDAIAIAS